MTQQRPSRLRLSSIGGADQQADGGSIAPSLSSTISLPFLLPHLILSNSPFQKFICKQTNSVSLCLYQQHPNLIPTTICLSKYPPFALSPPLPVAYSLSFHLETLTLPREPTCHLAMHLVVPSTARFHATTALRLLTAAASSTLEDSSSRPNFGIPALQSAQMILGLCTACGMLPLPPLNPHQTKLTEPLSAQARSLRRQLPKLLHQCTNLQ